MCAGVHNHWELFGDFSGSYNPSEGAAALALPPLPLGDPLPRSGEDSAKRGTKLVWTRWFLVPTVCYYGMDLHPCQQPHLTHGCFLLGRLGPAFPELISLCRAMLGCHPRAGGNALLKQAVWITVQIFLECTAAPAWSDSCQHANVADEFLCCVKSYLYNHVRVACWAPVTKP